VDYSHRQGLLQGLRVLEEGAGGDLPDPGAAARDVLGSLEDGRAKLFVTWKALTLRRQLPALFRDGDYKALNVLGERADQACAFARHDADTTLIGVVPRLLMSVLEEGQYPLGPGVWKDTDIDAEPLESGRYVNVFTGAVLEVESASGPARLPVGEVLLDFPVALLLREADTAPLSPAP
jgi:(1->4)-alpha-D-glucan 1-alpha-D-glucosylmutase